MDESHTEVDIETIGVFVGVCSECHIVADITIPDGYKPNATMTFQEYLELKTAVDSYWKADERLRLLVTEDVFGEASRKDTDTL